MAALLVVALLEQTLAEAVEEVHDILTPMGELVVRLVMEEVQEPLTQVVLQVLQHKMAHLTKVV